MKKGQISSCAVMSEVDRWLTHGGRCLTNILHWSVASVPNNKPPHCEHSDLHHFVKHHPLYYLLSSLHVMRRPGFSPPYWKQTPGVGVVQAREQGPLSTHLTDTLVSFPDHILPERGSGQLSIPFLFTFAGMLVHCSSLTLMLDIIKNCIPHCVPMIYWHWLGNPSCCVRLGHLKESRVGYLRVGCLLECVLNPVDVMSR